LTEVIFVIWFNIISFTTGFYNSACSQRIRGGAPRLCAIQIHVYFTYYFTP